MNSPHSYATHWMENEQDRPTHADLYVDHRDYRGDLDVVALMHDLFRHTMQRGIEIFADHKKFVSDCAQLCDTGPSPLGWGAGNGTDFGLAGESRACGLRFQKCFHRNGAAGKVAQLLGEPQGRAFASVADIAQVPFGATSGYGKLTNRAPVVAGPTKQEMWSV